MISATVMELMLWPLLVLGLGLSVSFLALHRPRHWMRPETFNATGWIWVAAILLTRNILLLIVRGGSESRTWPDALISIGMLAAIDVLLALRLVSYVHYRRASESGSR